MALRSHRMVYYFFGVTMTQLTKNFTLAELTKSSTGDLAGLDNTPNAAAIVNLKHLAENILQPLRDNIAKPIIVNSAYRSHLVNKAVGGADTSAHRFGHAVDLIVPSYAGGNVKKLCQFIEKFLKSKNIKFDQLIYEYGSATQPTKGWVHIGIKRGNGAQRGQVITINSKGTFNGIV